MKSKSKKRHTNALSKESSPYLLQHAHNPVDWHPWSDDVLELAQSENKMLLISIGYSSCHWCHVMERESFENEDIAQMMNEYFICVKVDREERPDIDQLYMKAVQLITGSGGWPLNCFALPDGRPVHGGTYFRPNDWTQVMQRIHNEYVNNKEGLEEFAIRMQEGIIETNQLRVSTGPYPKDRLAISSAVDKWKLRLDYAWGGALKAPKFPLPNNYLFLMRYAHEEKDEELMSQIDLTLDRMGSAGIYDQIGGGFSRYSVDEYWKVPHFEKMLYDNAQLIELYAEAYKRTRKRRYLKIVDQTIAWLDNEMKDESGLYYSALDADSEGVEGKFYVWNEAELRDLLGEDYDLAVDYFKIGGEALWEDGNNILHRNDQERDMLSKHKLNPAQYEMKIAQLKKILLQVRNKRVRPGLDDKCLTSWNAMLATGLLSAYRASSNPLYVTHAKTILDVLLKNALAEHGWALKHTYKNDVWKIDAFLDDYAFLIQACISYYESTFDFEYLDKAKDLTEHVIDAYYEEEQGLFSYSDKYREVLVSKNFDYYDNVIPSANSMMFRNLIWLDRFYDLPQFQIIYTQMKELLEGKVSSYGSGFSNWMLGMLDLQRGAVEMVISGPDCERLRLDLATKYVPGALWAGSKEPSDLPLLDSRWIKGRTLIYFCKNKACKLPIDDVADFAKIYEP